MPMSDSTNTSWSIGLRLVELLLNAKWVDGLAQSWKLVRRLSRGWADEGIYEVQEYVSRLELLDQRGERAKVEKLERVRYLQNGILAFQDQAWGDGKILVDYRCTPGVPVDFYRQGHKTYILIALHSVKLRGEMDTFHMQWEMHQSFTLKVELWSAEISHRTQSIRLEVTFPAKRFPKQVSILESRLQRVKPLDTSAYVRLPDGRLTVRWEKQKPRLHEIYSLQWEW